jgi:hypothetical protein
MFPKAKQYRGYRVLLDREAKHVDAVVVSTPDHHDIPCSVMAMRRGKHVYCEKPLGRNVGEVREAHCWCDEAWEHPIRPLQTLNAVRRHCYDVVEPGVDVERAYADVTAEDRRRVVGDVDSQSAFRVG